MMNLFEWMIREVISHIKSRKLIVNNH